MKLYKLILIILFIPLAQVYSQELDLEKFEKMKPRSIGPAGMSGRVTSIDAVNTNPDIIYIATASGGIWKSESGGISWKPIFDKMNTQSIGAIAIDQSNPDIIWAGTGEGNPRNSHNSGNGIYRSLDGGKNWSLMGLGETKTIHRIIIDPRNSNVVYVGATGSAWGPNPERGVYKTLNGGQNWDKILFVNDSTGVGDLVMDPKNPNKLIAAMWEHGRKPWFFTSGGIGSGLYITYDGGKNWQMRTSDDGLPKGELGRIGLAIYPEKPNIIYALVEAKVNGLYKSMDGGFKWSKISEKNIGNRPFYYADLFIDPKNENRLYNLWSRVSKSEDGGKSFTVLTPYSSVHPDFHAFWIHPENPDHIILGNDGGLAISKDQGITWRFIENLPLAQYYHINYDMDIPYNVYGGMQDNGSWAGPAYVWKQSGIRNSYWSEISFGDGFDVVPDRKNSRYGYTMSQGGYLLRYDRLTSYQKRIKPIHPDGLRLRFNWNAAIADDPFVDCGVYFGSQFLHRSTDCGNSWEIISPDLTTNDSTKQKQHESGGLTLDATAAENYTSITAIAPSTLNENVIWVGTDDGNVHFTMDLGENWENVSENISNMPNEPWIAQVIASGHDENEAFVVANNYRKNDWGTYVYMTLDKGKSWKSIAQANIEGFALSLVQDPESPNLLFLGTDQGLYVSLNKGDNWVKWTNGYPSVPTRDLKIHPREHDLIIGTFGRAAYILDDIRPLREIAVNGTGFMENPVTLFSIPPAYITSYGQPDGTRFAADAIFKGTNRPRGGNISYWIKKPANADESKKDSTDKTDYKKVYFAILDQSGDTVRNFNRKAEDGFNRFNWGLGINGFRTPSDHNPKKDGNLPSGRPVLAGDYTVIIKYGENMDTASIKVNPDPRSDYNIAEDRIRMENYRAYEEIVEPATMAYNRLKEAKKTIGLVKKQMINADEETKKSINRLSKTVGDSIAVLMEIFNHPSDKKGLQHVSINLNSYIHNTRGYIMTGSGGAESNVQIALQNLSIEVKTAITHVNGFFNTTWAQYQSEINAAELNIFKNYEPIEIKD